MKEYKKPQMIAKNLPTGSYAAGCPEKNPGYVMPYCKSCERSV